MSAAAEGAPTVQQPGAEIEAYAPRVQASLPAKVQYARELANSGLLPAAYRKQPANVLYAIEYGDMLGLSPMAAITGVHIIEGKPSASAGLISALVRRAGHKLRVTGDGKSATCQIVRCDDPDYVFQVTWTLRRNSDDNPSAEEAGLLGKQVWKNYPASMLKSRAITQCARDACEEALFGLHYTPEEVGAEVDAEGNVIPGEVIREPAPAVPPQAPAGAAWTDGALAQAAAFSDDDAGRALWAEVIARRKAGSITADESARLKELIRQRWAQIAEDAEVVEGTLVEPLDPADPWALKVQEIASADDAADAAQEIMRAVADGQLDDDRARSVLAAVTAKADTFESVARAA